MATYRNVLLAVLIAVIAGVRFPRQCSDTCCAGEFSLGSKCEKLRTCSDKGQYIIRAGNETQNNKCWCDECNRFAPIRPKRCWEKGQACGCKQCPEGTEPHIKDKNGQYVEHFDEDKHCKPLPNPNCTCACEPTGNKIGHWIGIGIAIGLVVCFVEWCIPWIYYCRRYKKYTFPFKFMPKESHKKALSEAQLKDSPEANTQAEVKDSPEANTQAEDQRNLLKADAQTEDPPNTNRSPESVSRTQESDDGWKDIKLLAQTAFDWTLVTKFKKKNFLTPEDIQKWLKDTFTNIFDANQGSIQPEDSGEDRLLTEWNAIMTLDEKFPLVIDVPSQSKIRQTAIATLMKVIKDKGDSRSPTCTPVVFHICLSEAGYGRLVKKLKDLDVGGASSNP